MKFRDDRAKASSLALGMMLALGACANEPAEMARGAAPAAVGPAADYPVVLGEPYSIDGELYTPADTLNYDQVGFAVPDSEGGAGVTVAHRTLPLPSYVEITSLDSGKTILARVERRGPMGGDAIVALSQRAHDQLALAADKSVRVRRVNPQEWERAKLRSGERAPERIETPKSLLSALRKKLPEDYDVSSKSSPASITRMDVTKSSATLSTPVEKQTVETAFASVANPPAPELPPLDQTDPSIASAAEMPKPTPAPAIEPKPMAPGDFVVQAGAYSSEANANRVAEKIGGQVTKSGRFFRVRTGPFSNRGEAQAALANVRAAGYTDATIYRN